MSYILEALKKAQAERQIGSTPTIHAPTLASVPAGQDVRGRRTPVIVAMVLMVAAIAGLATMLVRQQPAASSSPGAGTPAPVAQAAPAPAAPALAVPTPAVPAQADHAQLAVAQPNAAQPTTAQSYGAQPRSGSAPAQPATAQPYAAQAGAGPSPARAQAGDARVTSGVAAGASPSAPPLAATPGMPVRRMEAAPTPTGTAPRGADAAPAEEYVQSLHELPEPIQRAIPQVTLGGYMYSKNPADRLLLIDKVLRREGEEVAPGLVLDKLLPKQAVFSFRGYRYRVAL